MGRGARRPNRQGQTRPLPDLPAFGLDAGQVDSVTNTVEASDARTIFIYANNNGKPGGGVYAATGGSQTCVASVDFADSAFEAQALKIAATVKTVR
jgi:hypothetical protein